MENNWVRIFLALSLLLLFIPHLGFTQTTEELKALRKELEEIKKGQSNIQKELQEIKALLRGRAPAPPPEPQNVVLDIKDDPFKGQPDAKLTLIEFSDYQCPFCARHFRETLPQLEREYIAAGKVKYVFRNFPIESIHPQAFKAAEAANCASDQGKYWEMHERLFTNQQVLSVKNLTDHAQALELDLPKFQECLGKGKYAAKIRKDIADGEKAGVQGTPTFFLGLPEPSDSKLKSVRVIRGAQPYSAFKNAIEGVLSSGR